MTNSFVFLDRVLRPIERIIKSFTKPFPIFHLNLIIFEGTGWQAGADDYYQSLTIQLDKRYNITSIGTLGKLDTKEFVSEYYILTSDDGYSWNTYQSSDGHDEVLQLYRVD